MILSKEFWFEASHQLPRYDGKCARLHGHSWRLVVSIAGSIKQETGMVMDYAELKRLVTPVIEQLDHFHLGSGFHGTQYFGPSEHLQKAGFPSNPTSENILFWVASQLPKDLPWIELELNETHTSSCRLGRAEWEQSRGTK